MYAYLDNSVPVTKVGSYYCEILDIIFDVPRGSILEPLLFNINIIDLFLIERYKSDFSSYADDTTHIIVGTYFWKLYQTLKQQ